MDVQGILRRIDRYQQDRRWLAFPFAVVKKFGDDRAGYLAALIAYYGFFSVFPLLLVLVSVLAIVLADDPGLQHRIIDTALGQFPVIGDELSRPRALTGNVLVLVVGIATALWAGLGVTQAGQNAMNEIWDVPLKDRPPFLVGRLRGLIMLVVLGTLTLGTTFLAGLGTASGTFGGALRTVGFLGSLVLNMALFLIAFRVLTRRNLTWRNVFPGAGAAAVVWTGLQLIGSYYVSHTISGASDTYGTFALVIGLLAWFYLGAQLMLYCAEINVVLVRRLWPRSLVQPPLTEADRRTYRHAAGVEERVPQERVGVRFEGSGRSPAVPRSDGGARDTRPPEASGGVSSDGSVGTRASGGRAARLAGVAGAVFALAVAWRRRSKRTV